MAIFRVTTLEPSPPHNTSPSTEVRAATSASGPRPSWKIVAVAYGIVVLIAAVSAWINGRAQPAAPRVPEGITVLVLLLLLAQVIERLLEPIVRLTVSDEPRQARNEAVVASVNDPSDAKKTETAAEKQNDLDTQRSNVSVMVWAIASSIGMLLVAVTGAYMLSSLGIEGVADKRWLDTWVTGLAIGAGTKPIHDVISRIDEAKKAAKDPSEVG